MEDLRDDKGGALWPEVRIDAIDNNGNEGEPDPTRWLHSDIKNIALPYIVPVFDRIHAISEGKK